MSTKSTNNNDIAELREILFDTMRGLKSGSMKIEQAKAINDTAQVLINSAKAEIDMLELIGGRGTGFIPQQTPMLPKPGTLGNELAAASKK